MLSAVFRRFPNPTRTAVRSRMQECTYEVVTVQVPEHGLRRGDLGAVVEVYEPEGIEVEFVRASGVKHVIAHGTLAHDLDDGA